MPKFQERPKKLQEKVFEKLFNEAEIAKLKPEDMKAYEESLKVYRDNYSILETAKNEGKVEGIEEGKLEVAKKMLKEGLSFDLIAKVTGLSKEQLENL